LLEISEFISVQLHNKSTHHSFIRNLRATYVRDFVQPMCLHFHSAAMNYYFCHLANQYFLVNSSESPISKLCHHASCLLSETHRTEVEKLVQCVPMKMKIKLIFLHLQFRVVMANNLHLKFLHITNSVVLLDLVQQLGPKL
jgi:hypothetical protein